MTKDDGACCYYNAVATWLLLLDVPLLILLVSLVAAAELPIVLDLLSLRLL